MAGRGRETLRLFVAAYPEPEAARAMVRAAEGLGVAGARVEAAERVHLTLVFLGERRVSAVGEILESMRRAAAGARACELLPERLVTLPREAGVEPRVVAMTARAPGAFVELQRRLAQRLVEPSRRGRGEWLPHVTLARLEAGGGAGAAMDAPVPEVPAGPGPLVVRAISLVHSVQRSAGAEHRRLAEINLDG